VIYNHGSRAGHEREERPFAYVGNVLRDAGYIVLVPERRGYGRSDGKPYSEEIGQDRGPRTVQRLGQEAGDVLAALAYLRTLPYADMKRAGMMGWSFGGIVTIIACSRSHDFLAAVNQAGASLSWQGNRDLRAAMVEAANKITIPVLNMVARNDATTDAVKTVAESIRKHQPATQLIIYPDFHPARDPGIPPGHMIFSVEGVAIWKDAVVQWFDRYLAKTPAVGERKPAP
jgi:dienelactone hydrolase